jgi:hypothetical protein
VSTTFSLRLTRPPTRDALTTLCDEPDLGWSDEVATPWPDRTFTHVHLPGLSTRGLELGPEGGVFTVRVLSNSAPEELAMAVRLVAGLARSEGCTIEQDGEGAMDADTFEARFDAAWIAKTVEQDFAALVAMAADRVVSLPGPVRDTTFGPATLARVPATSDALLRVMRDVNYPNGPDGDESDEGELYVSKGIRVARDGREVLIHALTSGVSYFLSKCDVYALMDFPALHIPATELLRLAPDHVTPVDEVCVRLRAMEDDAWAEFLERARPIGHEDPFEAAPPDDRARPAGTLLPLLRPPSWRARDTAAFRPLLTSMVTIAHMPLVSIVSDTPVATASMPAALWPGAETATFEVSEQNAVANLDRLDLPFKEEVEAGAVTSLTAIGEYAAELLLSKRRLDEAHQKLGSLMVASTPIRGLLRLQRGDDVQGTGRLVEWAQRCFDDAGRRATGQPGLTPLVFGVVDGKVAALVQARADGSGDESMEMEAPVPRGGEPAAKSNRTLLVVVAVVILVVLAAAYALAG